MTSWTMRLIAANVIVYLLNMLAPGLTPAMMLVPADVFVRPWTIVTYMFMHANLTHILFNMLGLFFFGPRLELELGGKRFLLLYFISGISGGALSFLFTPYSAIVGASGAVFGVFLGFAYFWPRERIYIWGVLPVESRILVIIMTLLSLYGGLGGGGSDIAHFAHLGGFVGAYLYLKWVDKHSPQAVMMKAMTPPNPSRNAIERWGKIDREKLHEVNRAELDRIREKMGKTGAGRLTEQEISFLNRFSEEL
ncbi:MAG: rhomboid family intramembrane serine protease [Bacteroidota bacterium]